MKKANVKSKNKFIIAVNLFLIAILMVVAVYAWFASVSDNRVDAYDVKVEADSSLELSFDGNTWGGSLDLANLKNSDDTYVFDSMKFVEVTGEGTTFNVPQLSQKQNYAEVNLTGDWTPAVANKDYLQFKVYMRSKDMLNVYLGSESKATPVSTVIQGANCGNPSPYASGANAFSKDCVVGALRVAVKDASNAQKFIWITNPEFHLNNNIGSTDYSMTTNASQGDYLTGANTVGNEFYWNDPYTHYYYNASKTLTTANANSLPVIAGALPNSVTTVPSEQTKIASLTTKEGDFYQSEATITVWIEGCDTEARRALVDGKFNLSLVLDAFSTQ